ncbi:MAG: 30S ribosomal protein S20 [Firmicutes bacterium]|jgi:small subunit ribosomal protein S20|nr:30S ribosomal protein S20 [Bacillota bacterium]MDD4792911.1 30S ribosomal protein S20 [Bacillota bacterium]
MPNIRSAKKRARQTRTRTLRNLSVKSSVKTAVRRCHEAISELGPEASVKELNHAYSVIDRAAKKGAIHPNKAARLKSSLASRAAQASEASEA